MEYGVSFSFARLLQRANVRVESSDPIINGCPVESRKSLHSSPSPKYSQPPFRLRLLLIDPSMLHLPMPISSLATFPMLAMLVLSLIRRRGPHFSVTPFQQDRMTADIFALHIPACGEIFVSVAEANEPVPF